MRLIASDMFLLDCRRSSAARIEMPSLNMSADSDRSSASDDAARCVDAVGTPGFGEASAFDMAGGTCASVAALLRLTSGSGVLSAMHPAQDRQKSIAVIRWRYRRGAMDR
ncbi:hypothetical protein EGJ03_14455 [Stenotrophomonas maltophilia]|nr:hypothetical protein EGJ06_17255 [Stenotrophomonas maltophilia]RRU12259.1 hypothetical protein EGJ77_08325 [Stenotrophomonas maltophilia]RRU29463.1 hypothetical protein EGJ03_14455 [Stenotrophomonas maltophilia]RRU92210.1 hypothetical protein EGI91_14625 [Stenotrophomonas maltophilia]